jgi:hypothetical protein
MYTAGDWWRVLEVETVEWATLAVAADWFTENDEESVGSILQWAVRWCIRPLYTSSHKMYTRHVWSWCKWDRVKWGTDSQYHIRSSSNCNWIGPELYGNLPCATKFHYWDNNSYYSTVDKAWRALAVARIRVLAYLNPE